jgi:precorrin-4 methylase
MRFLQGAAVVLAAAGALGLGVTAPAMADTATAPRKVEQLPGDDNGHDVGVFAVAPSCVVLTGGTRGITKVWARATNNCGYAVRFRMIWAWAGDGACKTVSRYWEEERTWTEPRPYVSELRLC